MPSQSPDNQYYAFSAIDKGETIVAVNGKIASKPSEVLSGIIWVSSKKLKYIALEHGIIYLVTIEINAKQENE